MAAELRAPVMTAMNDEAVFERSLRLRNLRGNVWKFFFRLSLMVGILMLILLFLNIVNSAIGSVIINYEIAPEVASPDAPIESLDAAGLAGVLVANSPRTIPALIRDTVSAVENDVFTTAPMREVLAGRTYDPAIADLTIRQLSPEQQAQILTDNLDVSALRILVEERVLGAEVIQTFNLDDSLGIGRSIRNALLSIGRIFGDTREPETDPVQQVLAESPAGSRLIFKSWIDFQFLSSRSNTNAFYTGILTALQGTVLVVILTIVIAFPIGLGAAIYLEEYASRSPIHRIIETNIRNLAGVPSIIYGLLGLAIFVRLLSAITQGRTVLAAALTMALLIMPVIIINAQEALRAVPPSIREASYGMGATKWQTIVRTVIPAAIPGILTGTILAMSRAIGETAPLIIVGAATFILSDPGPLTRFTVLPIQIYRLTVEPQQELKAVAAAAIVVLLVLLLLLNATAIILRQRARRRLTA